MSQRLQVFLIIYLLVTLLSTFNASLHWGSSRDQQCNKPADRYELFFHGRFVYCFFSEPLKSEGQGE